MVAFGLLIPMRSLERWLHQHIFKVGWLLTKNLQTTTILYYTVFLPGVFLHELIVWFTAGILNVRAIGEFKFPDKQEIAELKLTFVKYDTKKVGAFKLFIINLTPLLGGMVLIWLIVMGVLQTDLLIRALSNDPQITFEQGFTRFINSPDLLLWLYFIFTISATMIPNPSTLKGGRLLLVPLAVAVIALFALGVGTQVLTNVFTQIAQGASLITGVFVSVIAVNLFITGVLGAIESIIERITGDSATFEKGKLIALKRADILAARAVEAEKARKALTRQGSSTKTAVSGPPSIYRVQFQIPDPPDKEAPAVAASASPPLLNKKPANVLPAETSPAVSNKPPVPAADTPKSPPPFGATKPTAVPLQPPTAKPSTGEAPSAETPPAVKPDDTGQKTDEVAKTATAPDETKDAETLPEQVKPEAEEAKSDEANDEA